MATYTWRNASNGAGGAFDVASNWSNANESVSTSVPTAADTASFAAGGGSISGSGSVDTIAFAAAAWSIVGQLTATTVTLDNGTLVAGTNGGQLVANGTLRVGVAATAALSVYNGGVVSVTGSPSGPVSNFGSATVNVYARGLLSFGGGLNFGVNGTQTTATVNAAAMTIGGVFQLGTLGAGTGTLSIVGGGQVVLSSATDTSTPYVKVGAVAGGSGSVAVDGPNSLLLLSNNSGAVGYLGTGTLTVTNGASARFNASANSSNNALNPALTIGRYGIGVVTVAGSGSLVAAGGSIIVGSAGSGTLRLQSGAAVTSAAFYTGQAALAVASASGGTGAVVIDGSGTALTASGLTIVGGDDRGSGLTVGGAGSISVSNGGRLQTNGMTLLSGSSVSVDGASQAALYGNLLAAGTFASAGTFVVSGSVYGGGLIQIGGGISDFGAWGVAGAPAATLAFTAGSATVRLHGIVGANTVSAMQEGDEIDLLGNTSVRLTGTTVTTATGTIALSAAPAGSHYELESDGAGGTSVALTADTIGVYRFFDSNYGTHFFSASASEKDTIVATRSDLVYEGVGLQSIDPASGDPAAASVYRFFDKTYGTHFFTASAAERDTVIATRSDLVYEGTGFIEHIAQQAGDTAVYRFFDSKYGTHFYTADANERATVSATRPDLIDEGIGFYAPTG